MTTNESQRSQGAERTDDRTTSQGEPQYLVEQPYLYFHAVEEKVERPSWNIAASDIKRLREVLKAIPPAPELQGDVPEAAKLSDAELDAAVGKHSQLASPYRWWTTITDEDARRMVNAATAKALRYAASQQAKSIVNESVQATEAGLKALDEGRFTTLDELKAAPSAASPPLATDVQQEGKKHDN